MFEMKESVSAAVLLKRVSKSVAKWHSSGEGIPDALFAFNRWGDWWPFPITAQTEAESNPNKLSEGLRGFQGSGTIKAYVLVMSVKFPGKSAGKKVRGMKMVDGVLAVCWAPGACGPFTKVGRTWRIIDKDSGKALQVASSFVSRRGQKDEIETWLDEPIAEPKVRP